MKKCTFDIMQLMDLISENKQMELREVCDDQLWFSYQNANGLVSHWHYQDGFIKGAASGTPADADSFFPPAVRRRGKTSTQRTAATKLQVA